MVITVFWTIFARKILQEIFEHYVEIANKDIAYIITDELIEKSLSLEKFQEIGQIEALIPANINGVRCLLHKNYKILYRINHQKNRVEVIDVFDTRQNPIKLKRNS